MSVEEKFLAAVDIINSLPSDGTFQPSEDLMLQLYAYYKQATEGPCNVPQPSVWYFTSRVKWNAWNELGKMQREVAMEKYVEELTKVIETMSYSETVSRFMSLIGPFYEIVSTEEVDQQPGKNSNSRSHTEFPYPVKNLEDLPTLKNETSCVELLESSISSISKDSHVCSPDSPLKRSLRTRLHSGSSTSGLSAQENVFKLFKPKTSSLERRPLVTKQDLLILAIINLKNSLEDIVKKLDHLHALAKSANFNYEIENEDAKDWDFGVGGTAFALLWPIAVHLWSRSF